MGYQIGGLDLPITANSFSAVGEIEKTITSLTRLETVLNNLSRVKLSSAQMQQNATAISSFINQINASSMTGISTFARFSSTLNKMDYERAVGGFGKLTSAIKPFLSYVQRSTTGLLALDSVLDKITGKKLSNLTKATGVGGGKGVLGSIFSFAKLTTMVYYMRRLGKFAGDLLQSGSDYAESLNMWQVSMRQNIGLAETFISKMNKAYGISEKTLMTTQATFKNMIGSLGQITDDVAYQLSEALTLMAVDYSSLYNVQLNKAFEKFQAMLAGQVRPIRTVSGLDITETTLFQLYQSIGGTKSMRQLTRTEKQLLSILSVYKQMGRAGALGDMTKTLDQYANQSRMLTEYWAQLKAWTGLVLKDLIQDWGILTKLNAVLITMSEIVRAIAKARGADDENFIDGMFESASDTNKEIDDLKGKLLDFDKFRSLEDAGAGDVDIDQALLQALTGYNSNIDKANNRAQELAETWLTILGFEEDATGALVPAEGVLDDIIGKAKILLGVLVGAPIALKGFSSLPTLFANTKGSMEALKKVGGNLKLSLMEIATTSKATSGNVTMLGKAFEFLLAHPVVLVIGAIVALLAYLYTTNEDVRKSINNVFKAFMPLFDTLGSFISGILTPMGGVLSALVDILTDGVIIAFDLLAININTIMLQMVPFMYALEFILKVLETILIVAKDLLSLDFSKIGEEMNSLWKNWNSTGYTKKTWSNFKSAIGIPDYANGGLPDKGSVFRAGEAGAEIVYNTPSGQTGVVNVSQIKEAVKKGTIEALNSWWGGNNARGDIPQLEEADDVGIYKLATSGAGKFGKGWSNK